MKYIEYTIYANFENNHCKPISGDSYYLPLELMQTIDDMGVYLNCDGEFNTNIECTDEHNVDLYFDLHRWNQKRTHIVSGITSSRFKKFLPYGDNELTVTTLSGDCECGEQDGVRSITSTHVVYCCGGIEYTMDRTEAQRVELDIYDDSCGFSEEDRNPLSVVKYSDVSTFKVESEGCWSGNTSVKNLVKDEFLFGYVFEPTVINKVKLNRGRKSVFELHMPFSALSTVDEIEEFNNGYYRIHKQISV